jgi:hypothetical protein
MPVIIACSNCVCVNPDCREYHHHSFQQRTILKSILDNSPEVTGLYEDHDPRRKVVCKHGLRCFEKDCFFIHSLNHDGRKIITKKFNKEWKAITMKEKIKKEIEEIRQNGMSDWSLM